MAVENKLCRGDGPGSSLLSSSGPEGERLSKIYTMYQHPSAVISDLSSDRCKFLMPNTFACRDELFPTAVAERLLVNVWRWGLKLLPKTKIR